MSNDQRLHRGDMSSSEGASTMRHVAYNHKTGQASPSRTAPPHTHDNAAETEAEEEGEGAGSGLGPCAPNDGGDDSDGSGDGDGDGGSVCSDDDVEDVVVEEDGAAAGGGVRDGGGTETGAAVHGLWEMKRHVEELISGTGALVSRRWRFQRDVLRKAQRQLVHHLFDEYGHVCHAKPTLTTRSLAKITTREHLVLHYHKKVMRPYRKWCKTAYQKYRDPWWWWGKASSSSSSSSERRRGGRGPAGETAPATSTSTPPARSYGLQRETLRGLSKEKLAVINMLLLFCVWGEVDMIRVQNNVCFLLYHAAKQWLSAAQTSSSSDKKNTKYGPLREHNSVGDMLRYESLYLLEMTEVVGFKRHLRNEHYLAWEDINTMAWSRPFVKKFLKWYSWQRTFRMRRESTIHMTIMLAMESYSGIRLGEDLEPIDRLRDNDIRDERGGSGSGGGSNDDDDDGDDNGGGQVRRRTETAEGQMMHKTETTQNENVNDEVGDSDALRIHVDEVESNGGGAEGMASEQRPRINVPFEEFGSPASATPTPLKSKEEQQRIKEERTKERREKKLQGKDLKKREGERKGFVRRWKTFFDRAGGPFGLFGYFTMIHTFAIPIYVQLVLFTVMMYVFIEVPHFENTMEQPIVLVILCSFPLVVMGVMIAFQALILQWTTKPLYHPYKLWLPKRGSGSYRVGNQFNYVVWILVLLSQGVVVRFLVFGLLESATHIVLAHTREGTFDYLSLVIFVFSWIPVFFVYWTVAPILFTLWTTFICFVVSLFRRISRIVTWSEFKRYLRSTSTLKHFQRKLLGPENQDLEIEKVMYRFALFFNGLIDDMYEDHLCSYNQKKKLSFHLTKYHVRQEISIDSFRRQISRITGVTPKNARFQRYLIRFLNSLYQPMPASIGVEAMRRINIVTPVYKESVMYGWEELIRIENTDISFLKHLIKKHPYDWKNFRDKELEHRGTLLHIEQKLLSGVDMRGHYVPEYLKAKIRLWASKRFQSVARTIEGLCKNARALKLLLRVQTLQKGYTDEQLDAIVRNKFKYVVGGQVLHKSTWGDNEDMSQYVDDFLYMLERNGDYMKLAYQRKSRCGGHWEAVLLGKQTHDSPIEQEYRITTLGKFDNKGQGKPAHQAFLLQFIDGTVVQCLDCNQDAYISQLVFMPNATQEFNCNRNVKIVGFPEYVFTEDWSMAGYSAALIEKVFGSLVQRSWSMLSMRLHYGHPDLIDGLWTMFTTGLSKMSYVSEDIFTGFDTLLNGGKVRYVDYIEVGKARDVCLFSTSKFNRKTSGGAAQMAVSREIHELMWSFKLNPAEKLTFLYTTIAHYLNTVLVLTSTYIVFTLRVIMLILRFFQTDMMDNETAEVWRVLDVIFIVQIGLTLSIPGLFETILSKGWMKGIYEYIIKLRFVLVSIYSIFHLLHQSLFFHIGFKDAAQYIPSGRGAGLSHESIGKIVTAFDTSHFIPAIILFALGVIGFALGQSGQYFVYTLLITTIWLWSPFMFNRGSFPFDVGYATWIKLYTMDIEYIRKWKVLHIITEVAKRRKNVLKIEKHQNELIDKEQEYANTWFPDVQDIDEDALEQELEDSASMETSSDMSYSESNPQLQLQQQQQQQQQQSYQHQRQHSKHLNTSGRGHNINMDAVALVAGTGGGGAGGRTPTLSTITYRSMTSSGGRRYVYPVPELSLNMDEKQQDRDFKFRQERSKRLRPLARLRKIVIYAQAGFWNAFLLITMMGIKYVSLLISLLQLLNPLDVPGKREVDSWEKQHASNEKRFFRIQKYIQDVSLRPLGKRWNDLRILQQEINQLKQGRRRSLEVASPSDTPQYANQENSGSGNIDHHTKMDEINKDNKPYAHEAQQHGYMPPSNILSTPKESQFLLRRHKHHQLLRERRATNPAVPEQGEDLTQTISNPVDDGMVNPNNGSGSSSSSSSSNSSSSGRSSTSTAPSRAEEITMDEMIEGNVSLEDASDRSTEKNNGKSTRRLHRRFR